MWLSSSLLVASLHACLLVSFCFGDRSVFRIVLVTSSTLGQSATTTPSRSTSRTAWRHLPRGGADGSAMVENEIETNRKLPSLFQSESDTIYDRYAACLAATEGLRRIRDQALQSQQQSTNEPLRTKRNIREAKEWATAVYAENASKVIEAMGMTVSQFNSIGKVVCNDATLKQKVCDP